MQMKKVEQIFLKTKLELSDQFSYVYLWKSIMYKYTYTSKHTHTHIYVLCLYVNMHIFNQYSIFYGQPIRCKVCSAHEEPVTWKVNPRDVRP